ncbi:MAG TPA: ATP-binding protein [Candidatus Binatia bacterium]|nr:ATP-binding protein [Candidatus Binatia bacterium]
MRFVPRTLTSTLRRALRTFPAILVTGPRQSGKTTLLRHEFGSSHHFVSLERPDIRARALEDPMGFLADHPPPVILDEIQYAPDLLHFVKERIDSDRRPGRWLFTGSQSFPLMQGVTQSLAGRVAVLILEPLSVAEALGKSNRASLDRIVERVFGAARRSQAPKVRAVDLGDWLLRGGYPEPRLNLRVDRSLWFASYVQTYLERDVRDVLRIGDLASFNRFVALVAARTGSILNLSELGRDAGVSGPTARQWLSVLEASELVYLLKPYFRNFGKRIIKSPKLYFLDPGIVTFLLGLHTKEAILRGPSIGALLETAVVCEWLKAFRHRGERPELYFWRSSTGEEVDLVFERNGRLHGVEVKATATPVPKHAAALVGWLALAGEDSRGVLACRTDDRGFLTRGIRTVPWHLAWCGG